ncbi:MAG: Exodeoxyribonuclease I [Alphaproteobacteria bacterium MarineAlpha5_Bin9]|nr:MAG: Exodeoxyribonuclease I [Alphaproteobacteria bacterium MarineAlpha5_Bin9]|tara:strand:+ start:29430 stop:30944 length:1515 start_codon:yes stop_codon:yes gene_type:complete
MNNNYIFYDFETTGKGKKENPNSFGFKANWEQILQVGAIVTNENLTPSNKTLNEFCRLRTSIIPQPGALLTTNKTIQDSITAKLSSYELISLINKVFLEWKDNSTDSIFIGHNTLEFDETVLEYNLLNNLYFPYITRPNRGDTLNLARGMYGLNPSLISVGSNAKGSQIFKLGVLAELNNLGQENAHDALSDVRTTISLAKYIYDNDIDVWKNLELTMNAEKAANFINNNRGFCCINYWFGKIQIQALSMVCESQYKGWYHTIDLKHDPEPIIESNNDEFKKIIKKKNRYVICNKNPILFSGKLATRYSPYDNLGSDLLNERAKKVFKNKTLSEKFKYMELDRQLEKEEMSSQDNIFPESKANMYLSFGQQDVIRSFHQQDNWKDKYKYALMLEDPRASFIAKRLIFDESPETLNERDFKFIHQELHDRLVINQHRPFTTIPESMNYVDTELSNIEDNNDTDKESKIKTLKDFNTYLIFLEKYFSNKNAEPLKKGKDLLKQIFG